MSLCLKVRFSEGEKAQVMGLSFSLKDLGKDHYKMFKVAQAELCLYSPRTPEKHPQEAMAQQMVAFIYGVEYSKPISKDTDLQMLDSEVCRYAGGVFNQKPLLEIICDNPCYTLKEEGTSSEELKVSYGGELNPTKWDLFALGVFNDEPFRHDYVFRFPIVLKLTLEFSL